MPQRHQVSDQRADHWVLTCADERVYGDLLVPWLGSLVSVARWQGQIVVFDYGLSEEHAQLLRDLGVLVEPVPQRHFVNLDRFLHLASFAEANAGLIAQWDADVWFADTIDPLFDDQLRESGERLVCNLDRVFQTSCYQVAREDPRILAKVRSVLEPIVQRHGNVLQCGFLGGPAATLGEFCRLLERLIENGEYHPEWNSDTVGLNYWYGANQDRVRIIDQRYNCLPDWQPQRRGSHFYLNGEQMRVLHVTSPWRASSNGDRFRFQAVHPQLHAQWRERLRA